MTSSPGLAPLEARLLDPSTFPTTALQVEMLVVVYLISILAYITYGLRMYSRITSKQWGFEDWLMTAAMVCCPDFLTIVPFAVAHTSQMFSIPLVILQYFYYKYVAVGLPYSAIKGKGAEVSIHILLSKWLDMVLYPPVLGLVKASTLVFMLRIAGHMQGVKRAIHIINFINVAVTISQCAGMIFNQIPVSSYWDESIPAEQWIDIAAFITSMSVLTIVTDILVLSIPFWVFMRSQLPKAMRCGVVMIFMTSGLVTVIGIIRVCVFTQAFYEPEDGRFECTWGPSLNAIETSLAVMTANLPTLSPLLREWFPGLFRNFRRGNTDQRRYIDQEGSGKQRSVQMQDLSHRHNPRSVSNSTTESQQGFFKHAGIRKTTDIRVAYSDRSIVGRHAGETGRAGRSSPSDPALMV